MGPRRRRYLSMFDVISTEAFTTFDGTTLNNVGAWMNNVEQRRTWIVKVEYGEAWIINVEQRRTWIVKVELVNPGCLRMVRAA